MYFCWHAVTQSYMVHGEQKMLEMVIKYK